MIFFACVLLFSVQLHFCATGNPKTHPYKADFTPRNDTTPQALFFRTDASSLRNNAKTNIFQDLSLLESLTNMTEISTTLKYDENATSSDEEAFTTTGNVLNTSSTDIDFTTEISIFSKNISQTTTAPAPKQPQPTKRKDEFCPCDLTFHSCDVNCCCDEDCSKNETKLFSHCMQSFIPQDQRFCYSHIFYYKNNTGIKIKLESDNLFCIVKDNLPTKINTNKYHEITDAHEAENLIKGFYKWPENDQPTNEKKYKTKPYAYGDPILSINNGIISVINVPGPYLNDYCHRRSPIKFLMNSKHKCTVKVADLEMFQIYEYFNRTLIAGIPQNVHDENDNLVTQNCSTIHCIQWVLFVCNENSCEPFNKSTHVASCDDIVCNNIATSIKYVFHCLTSRINKAHIFLYTTTIRADTQLHQQEIIVKYYLDRLNETENPVDLSGNPGYNLGKPIITSRILEDGTPDFFANYTFPLKNIVSYPKNVNGHCILSNFSHETIIFGYNMKTKCRFIYFGDKYVSNASHACNLIQNNMYAFLGLHNTEKVRLSPLGNPFVVAKEEWVNLVHEKPINQAHGEYLQGNKMLRCSNFVSILSYEFTNANVSLSDTSTDRKILRGVVRYRDSEVEFDLENDISITIRTDVLFFDITRPVHNEYARGPYLNIHLPSDFFYPFTSNLGTRSQILNVRVCYIIVCVISLLIKR